MHILLLPYSTLYDNHFINVTVCDIYLFADSLIFISTCVKFQLEEFSLKYISVKRYRAHLLRYIYFSVHWPKISDPSRFHLRQKLYLDRVLYSTEREKSGIVWLRLFFFFNEPKRIYHPLNECYR